MNRLLWLSLLRHLLRHPWQLGLAILGIALGVAFATTVGIGVMVDSFRSGVIVWLQDVLTA